VEATRRAVLAAARAAFGTKGSAQTSIDEIAAAARVTKGAVYHHFSGKEALFQVGWAEVEADATARAAAARDPQAPPIDQLVTTVDAYLEIALDDEVRQITLIDGPVVLGLEPEGPADQVPGHVALRGFIAEAIGRSELHDLDPGVFAHLVGGLALLGGLLIARAGDPETTRATASGRRRGIATVVATGLDHEREESFFGPARRDPRVAADMVAALGGCRPRLLVDAADAIPRFDRPVLLIWSESDGFFGMAQAHRLASAFPQATLVSVPGAKTWVPVDDPAAVAAGIAAHVPVAPFTVASATSAPR
jgi:AcrR family transcriptional regulator